jgi:hypothetical protein
LPFFLHLPMNDHHLGYIKKIHSCKKHWIAVLELSLAAGTSDQIHCSNTRILVSLCKTHNKSRNHFFPNPFSEMWNRSTKGLNLDIIFLQTVEHVWPFGLKIWFFLRVQEGQEFWFLQCPNNLDSLFSLGGKHDE